MGNLQRYNHRNNHSNNNFFGHHSRKNHTAVRVIHLVGQIHKNHNHNYHNHHNHYQNDFILVQKPSKGKNLRCLRIFCGIFFGIIEMILGIIILASNPQDQDAIDGGIALLVVGFLQCCVCLCPKQQNKEKTGYRSQIE